MNRWQVVMMWSALAVGGCGNTPTASSPATPPSTMAPPPAPLTAPQLLHPVEGATINQNDPTIGCPPHRTAGYGFIITFDWAPVGTGSEVIQYELLAMRDGATLPLANPTRASLNYVHVVCNSYVADANLKNWKWKVRAIRSGTDVGPWSAERPFRFAPCYQGGQHCH